MIQTLQRSGGTVLLWLKLRSLHPYAATQAFRMLRFDMESYARACMFVCVYEAQQVYITTCELRPSSTVS